MPYNENIIYVHRLYTWLYAFYFPVLFMIVSSIYPWMPDIIGGKVRGQNYDILFHMNVKTNKQNVDHKTKQ